jgi:hypothetical protein
MSAKRQPTFKHPMCLLALGVATGLLLLGMSYEMKKTEGVILGREKSGRGGVVSTASGLPTPDAPRRSATRGGVEEVHPVQRKLESIILPSVFFNQCLPSEAIGFLKKQTKEAMEANPDPLMPEVRWPEPIREIRPDAPTFVQRSTIELSGENISVWDVLQEIARQANIEIVLEGDGVVFKNY